MTADLGLQVYKDLMDDQIRTHLYLNYEFIPEFIHELWLHIKWCFQVYYAVSMVLQIIVACKSGVS